MGNWQGTVKNHLRDEVAESLAANIDANLSAFKQDKGDEETSQINAAMDALGNLMAVLPKGEGIFDIDVSGYQHHGQAAGFTLSVHYREEHAH